MSFPFDPQQGLVIVRAELFGRSTSAILRLALDSGATRTVVNVGPLVALGYDPSLVSERVQVTTGSGVEFAPQVPIAKVIALGRHRLEFSVLAHTLPPSAGVDGLLGLDFLRGEKLTVDFRKGELTLD